ncbi:MAG TPA: HEAT repeat domain-containing protein, partial [Pyrinomonadaceae bacterium]|nr:HEAT repeat domain-containing protein [Pyrinomonadaceae bacterium]
MTRTLLAILIGLFGFGPALNAAGQSRKIDSPEVLKQLLTMPAPMPRHSATPTLPQVVDTRPPEFYAKAPPDDAPVQDLVDYWSRWVDSDREPSEAVSKRLLEACVADPSLLPPFLNLLPDEDSTATKVKNVYDKALQDPKFDQDWREKVRRWLLYNSTYFLDELLAMAHKAKDNQRDGDVDKEDALTSLAAVSWSHAEPLLRGLMASGQPRATALALSLYYEHAVDEKDLGNEERYRRQLQAIASNRSQPGYARSLAIETLSLGEWSGLEEWYLGLFQDESLFDLGDGEYSLTPLDALFSSDLEKWIPIMTRLVESKDINVRTAAAARLATVDLDEETSKKALTPLLPWLSNRAWANDATGGYRLRLIQALGNIKIPESVPGLIAVLETDEPEGSYARGFAAQSLALYQDARAIPALKKALEKEKDESQRLRIIRGLLGSNALTETEQLEALEAYATKITSPEAKMDVIRYRLPGEEPLASTLMIGKYLGQSRETPSESFINAVLTRAAELKSQNSPVGDSLVEIAHQWQGHQIELDIIRRIGNGSADSNNIFDALQRKDKMQEALRTELQSLASVEGAAQGVGAVLLNDGTLAQGILNSQDEAAQIGLLACSRLGQMPLPVEMVGPLLNH